VRDAPSRCSTCGVELVGGVRAAPGVDAGPFLEFHETWRDAVLAREWDQFAALFADNMEYASYMTGFSFRLSGRKEFVSLLAELFAREANVLDEILDVRGQWCVARLHIFGPGDDDIGPWDMGRVRLVRMDGGLCTGLEVYDETDIRRAQARLNEVAGG